MIYHISTATPIDIWVKISEFNWEFSRITKVQKKMSKFERMSNNSGSNNKPPTTRYFAAWEVDRTPSNCVPRWVYFTDKQIRLTFCWNAIKLKKKNWEISPSRVCKERRRRKVAQQSVLPRVRKKKLFHKKILEFRPIKS